MNRGWPSQVRALGLGPRERGFKSLSPDLATTLSPLERLT